MAVNRQSFCQRRDFWNRISGEPGWTGHIHAWNPYVSVTKIAHNVVLNFKLNSNTDYLAHFHLFIVNICYH